MVFRIEAESDRSQAQRVADGTSDGWTGDTALAKLNGKFSVKKRYFCIFQVYTRGNSSGTRISDQNGGNSLEFISALVVCPCFHSNFPRSVYLSIERRTAQISRS